MCKYVWGGLSVFCIYKSLCRGIKFLGAKLGEYTLQRRDKRSLSIGQEGGDNCMYWKVFQISS